MWIDDKIVLARIADSDKVLDVGGWACPFNRADYVLDAMPHETRGFYRTIGLPASQGGDVEHFTKETWLIRDICDKQPWPFADKFFDFAICAHVLEDVRDPLFICSELARVAKAGYIEVPSRLLESCRGCEGPEIAGLSHHRWLITKEGNRLDFMMKFHAIHSSFDLSLPESFLKTLTADQKMLSFFWEDAFEAKEIDIHGLDNIHQELRNFVGQHHRFPAWRRAGEAALKFNRRVVNGVRRRLTHSKP